MLLLVCRTAASSTDRAGGLYELWAAWLRLSTGWAGAQFDVVCVRAGDGESDSDRATLFPEPDVTLRLTLGLGVGLGW